MQLRYFFLLVGTIAFTSCGSPNSNRVDKKKINQPLAKTDAPIVTLGLVKEGEFEMEVLSNGKAMAFKSSQVKFPFSGKIERINVANGDISVKNQVLCILDGEELRNSLARSKELLDRAVIELDDRLIDYGYRLKDSARTPKDILKMAKMKSGFNSAKFDYSESMRNLKRTIIYSPLSGKVADLEGQERNYAEQGRVFCNIIDDHQMRVDFKVLESEYRLINKGAKITVIPFGTDIHVVGQISNINPIIESSGMIKVTGLVKNSNAALINGMAVRVIISKKIPKALFIPKEAIVQRQDKEIVFTYKDGHAIWNYVETASENSRYKTIISGLSKDDVIILSNNSELANNSPVMAEKVR